MSNPSDPRMFEGSYNNKHPEYWTKITLRDLFAAAALAGYTGNPGIETDVSLTEFAGLAYRQADRMLAARDRGEGES